MTALVGSRQLNPGNSSKKLGDNSGSQPWLHITILGAFKIMQVIPSIRNDQKKHMYGGRKKPSSQPGVRVGTGISHKGVREGSHWVMPLF